VIVGVSDHRGGVFAEKGLDLEALRRQREETGTVIGAPGTSTVTNAELLELPCDILVPAAVGGQIRGDNAGRVSARLVVEGANGPTTPAADRILAERGVVVVPDILANAGGVIVSYFEWVQNTENEQWDLDEVNHKLHRKLVRATEACLTKQSELVAGIPALRSALEETRKRRPVPDMPLEPVDLRTAAYVLAIARVTSVALERGIWP
jgi:glutamate dehydrogenase/leucine dehydrogenase